MIHLRRNFTGLIAIFLIFSFLGTGCVSIQSNFAKSTYVPSFEHKNQLDVNAEINTNSMISLDANYSITDNLYISASAGFGAKSNGGALFSSRQSDEEKDFRIGAGFYDLGDSGFGLKLETGTRNNTIFRRTFDYDLTRNEKIRMIGLTPSYTFKFKKLDLGIGANFKFEKTIYDNFEFSKNEDPLDYTYPEFAEDQQMDLFVNFRIKMSNGWSTSIKPAYLFSGAESLLWDINGGSLFFNNTQRFRINLGMSKRFGK